MAKEVRVYGDKVLIASEMKAKLLHFANDTGVEPQEAFNRLIDRGYRLWVAQRRRRDRSKQRRP